jgi:hypothetical protein
MAGFNLEDVPVKKASTLKEPRSITVYGPPGKGKTVFAASISEVEGFERTLILDTEGGAVSVGEHYPNADVVECPTAAIFTMYFEAIITGKFVERESGLPYQAVIIDTIDKAQARQIEVYDRSPESRTKTGEKNTMYKWGAIKAWNEKLTDAAHQSPILFIFVVHSEDYTNEKTGVSINTVMLQGSSRDNFPSVSDAVGYFNVVAVKEGNEKRLRRAVDFRVDTRKITKHRFADRLNEVFYDPTMKQIFSKIRGN